MDSTPRISAIIPVYNGRKYLREAVESVIAQTLPPIELIIVDDGSTDGSMDVLDGIGAPFPIVRLRQENAGQSAARNHGAKGAKGDYIALCDQDDIWFPRHLAEMSKPFFKKDGARIGWVYSNWSETDENGGTIRTGYLDELPLQHPKRDLGHILGAGMIIQPGATLIRRTAFDAVGGFDPLLSGYEDDDLFTRMFYAGWSNRFIGESLSTWRIYWSSSQFKPRTTQSRRYYAEKLMRLFPDDPGGMRMWVRDAIAPRFFGTAVAEYNRALILEQWSVCEELAKDAMSYAQSTDNAHIGRKSRMVIRLMKRPRRFASLQRAVARLPFFLRKRIAKILPII